MGGQITLWKPLIGTALSTGSTDCSVVADCPYRRLPPARPRGHRLSCRAIDSLPAELHASRLAVPGCPRRELPLVSGDGRRYAEGSPPVPLDRLHKRYC